MSKIEDYIKLRERAISEIDAELLKSAIDRQVVLLDTRHEFEDLINEHDMGYTFYHKTYGKDLHFILSFWYKGTNYEEQGIVCTVNTEAYEDRGDAELNLFQMGIKCLNELKSAPKEV